MAGAVIVRRERADDVAAARQVQIDAFRRPEDTAEPAEAGLLDALRSCDGWIPQLSWVAEIDGVVVGHCVSTRGHIGEVACVGLGPIGVLSAHQTSGVGSALMHASIGAADAAGEPCIALLGSPDYYRRFGFVASTDLGIEAPDPAWGAAFQVRTLTAWDQTIVGQFRYAPPFDGLD